MCLIKMETDAFRMMPFNSPAGAELFLYAKELMKAKEAAGDTEGVLHMILQPDKDGNTITEEEFRNSSAYWLPPAMTPRATRSPRAFRRCATSPSFSAR